MVEMYVVGAYSGTSPRMRASTFPKFAMRYSQTEVHMKKVWQTSSILQFHEGVTFSMPSGLDGYFIAYQTTATYGK